MGRQTIVNAMEGHPGGLLATGGFGRSRCCDRGSTASGSSGSTVGGTADWPAAGGPFLVLERAGYDPRIGEGPGLWNTGAWLSAGFLSGILLTVLGMLNAMLTGVERLLISIAPICLAAYALPATQRVANLWLKVLGAVLAVRFAWSLLFVFFVCSPRMSPRASFTTRNQQGSRHGSARGSWGRTK